MSGDVVQGAGLVLRSPTQQQGGSNGTEEAVFIRVPLTLAASSSRPIFLPDQMLNFSGGSVGPRDGPTGPGLRWNGAGLSIPVKDFSVIFFWDRQNRGSFQRFSSTRVVVRKVHARHVDHHPRSCNNERISQFALNGSFWNVGRPSLRDRLQRTVVKSWDWLRRTVQGWHHLLWRQIIQARKGSKPKSCDDSEYSPAHPPACLNLREQGCHEISPPMNLAAGYVKDADVILDIRGLSKKDKEAAQVSGRGQRWSG